MIDCKYGYDIKDNVMRLTLLKSPIHPDTEADRGIHEFTYALFPHNEGWKESNVESNAWHLNNPLIVEEGSKDCKSLFQVSAENVQIDAVKKHEYQNLVILRLHEYMGKRGVITITSDFIIESFTECDLMENSISEVFKTRGINVEISPYEIKTIKVKFHSIN